MRRFIRSIVQLSSLVLVTTRGAGGAEPSTLTTARPLCDPPVMIRTSPVDGESESPVAASLSAWATDQNWNAPYIWTFWLDSGGCQTPIPACTNVQWDYANFTCTVGELVLDTDYSWKATVTDACGSTSTICATFHTAGCALREVGAIDRGLGQDVRFSGGLAYVATTYGLEVWDISNPDLLVRRSAVHLRSGALTIRLVGSLAFVSCNYDGISVIDVTNPDSPVVVGNWKRAGSSINEFDVEGTTLVAVDPYRRLLVLDVSDPSSIALRSSTNFPSIPWIGEVRLAGGRVYEQHGLIYDVTNPSSPVLVRSGEPFGTDGFDVLGSRLYACHNEWNNSRIDVWSLVDPDSPALIGTVPEVSSRCYQLRATGDRMFLACETSELGVARAEIWSLSNLDAPVFIGATDPVYGGFGRLDGSGPVVADAAGDFGLRAIDVTNAALPRLGAYTREFGASRAGKIVGRTLFDGQTYRGLAIYDLSDPRLPREMSVVKWGRADWIWGVDAESDIAVVSTSPSSYAPYDAWVVDASDPYRPEIVSRIPALGAMPRLRDHFLYTRDSNARMSIWDLTNPRQPTQRGTLAGSEGYDPIILGAQYAYVYSWNAPWGARIVDISDPDAPSIVGSFPPFGPESCNAIYPQAASGNQVAISQMCPGGFDPDNPDHPVVWRIDDPLAPERIADVETPFATLSMSDGFVWALETGTLWPGGLFLIPAAAGPAHRISITWPEIGQIWSLAPDSRGQLAVEVVEQGSRIFDGSSCTDPTGCLLAVTIDPPGPLAACSSSTDSILLHGRAEALRGCGSIGALDLQWLIDGAPISGATGINLELTPPYLLGTHRYQLRASCSFTPSCVLESSAVEVAVAEAPSPSLEGVRLRSSPFELINWDDQPGATLYEVRASPSPAGPFDLVVAKVISGRTGTRWGAVIGPNLFFQVSGHGGCDGELAPDKNHKFRETIR